METYYLQIKLIEQKSLLGSESKKRTNEINPPIFLVEPSSQKGELQLNQSLGENNWVATAFTVDSWHSV